MRQVHSTRIVAVVVLLAGLTAGACKPKNTATKAPVSPPLIDNGGPAPVANVPCQTPSITLTANSSTIEQGQVSTLTWQAFNADSLRIEPEIGTVQLAGNRQVTPQSSVTYTATATSKCGVQSGVTRITVNDRPTQTAVVATPPVEVINIPPQPASASGGNRPTTSVNPLPPTRDPSFGESMLSILFDYDQAELRSDQVPQLQTDAAWLKQHPNVRVIIEGHADERGNQEYNLALGARRANTVVQYLVSQGITESRIRTISYGKERPVCEDGTEGCHQKNRRAAFTETR